MASATASSKKRLSLFLFGLSSLTLSKHSDKASLSPTNPADGAVSTDADSIDPSFVSTHSVTNAANDNNQLSSPVNSPVLLNHSGLPENPESSIFERLVQESIFDPSSPQMALLPKCVRCASTKSKGCTHNSLISLKSGHFMKNEDLIAPALDATTSILSNNDANLDDVEMIYSSRRNSSVLGLNMALGRPFTPLRKNSTFSINQSLTGFQPMLPNAQPQSPVSPPKLTSSKSSVSFYSYADMINNDEFARRPSFKLSYSHGFVPTLGNPRKLSVSSNSSSGAFPKKVLAQGVQQPSILSKQLSIKEEKTPAAIGKSPSVLKKSLNKFLISPESSDSEEHDLYTLLAGLDKRKSFSSQTSNLNSIKDDESLISSSIADCIRQTTTEINGH